MLKYCLSFLMALTSLYRARAFVLQLSSADLQGR